MTSIEWLVNVVQSCIAPNYIPKEIIDQAKEMHKTEQETLYTEEQVREALFYALNVNKTTCCTTRTTDSIVREIIKSIKN